MGHDATVRTFLYSGGSSPVGREVSRVGLGH